MSGPRIDLHAHPGQFFLDGLAEDDPTMALRALGGEVTDIADLGTAAMTAISFATISDMRALALDPAGGLTARADVGDDVLYADHLRQLENAHSLARRFGLPLLLDGDDLDAATNTGAPRMWLACEGADFVGEHYERIAEAWEKGVRSIQLVHYRASPYGDLQTLPASHRGLSPAGAEVVRELNRLKMVVDLAHASFETTRDVVRLSTAPIMVSHTHLDGTERDHPRMITVEHAKVVADSGGLIGVWPSGFSSQSFDDFVREVTRLVEAVGAAHVGIGTDMDGNYHPVMTTYEQFDALQEALLARSLSVDEVDGILGSNAARLIRTVCG